VHCFSTRLLSTAACLLFVACGAVALAAPPASENLLPNSTKGYFSIGNVPELAKSWEKTQVHQLLNDPVMKPFTEDLHRQLDEKWLKSHEKIGLSIEDLRGIATGELAAAMVGTTEGKTALAVFVDITGQEDRAQDVLKKASEELIKDGGKRSQQKVAGVDVTIYEIPAHDDPKLIRRVVYFQKDGLLCGTDDLAVAADVLKRWDGRQPDNLSSQQAYKSVMGRCQAAAGELKPHVRWFVDPLGFAEAMRIGDEKKMKTLKMLRNQGFAAIQGVGGYLNFVTGDYEILHRTAIYAPPPYEKAMRMLSFPNRPDAPPLAWVPRSLATYTTVQCDIKNAFEYSATLIDEAFGGENVLRDLIEEIREDPNGPQIDIRRDLVGHLGQRATVLTDYKLPITPTSERLLFAVETTDEKALAEAVKKSLQDDPDVIKRVFGEYVIWEMKSEEPPVAAVVVEHPGGGGDGTGGGDLKPAEKKAEEVRLPNAAIAVAKGHLFVSSHVDFLEKTLSKLPERDRLDGDVDYLRVSDELKKLGAGEASSRNFSRIDDEYRVTYELFRAGKLPEADTMLAHLINRALGEEKEGVIRKARLDGSKLPDYDVVRRYLGVGGSYVTSEKDGWIMVGFVLNKEPAATVPDVPTSQPKVDGDVPKPVAAAPALEVPKVDDPPKPDQEAPKTDAVAPETDGPKSE
jgi:hypothetical protein